MALRWSVVAALLGCGRLDFTPRGDAGAPWWNPAWTQRVAITIDHTRVAGDLADFPALIELDTALLAPALASDAHDLVFVDAGNQPLAYDLEPFAAASPTVIAWVRVPQLAAATDTTLYAYVGNPAAAPQAQPALTWSNGFAGVYHFGDGTSLDLHDALALNDGTNVGATAQPVGMVLGGVQFATTNVQVPTTGLDTTGGATNTVTFWMKFAGPVSTGPFAFDNGPLAYDLWFYKDGCFGFNTQQSEVLGSTMTGMIGRWVHVAAVFYNGVPDATHNALYLDGAAQPLTPCISGAPAARSVVTPAYWGGNPGYQMNGGLDEARFARGARDATWIATEFANQSDPRGFITVGAVENRP